MDPHRSVESFVQPVAIAETNLQVSVSERPVGRTDGQNTDIFLGTQAAVLGGTHEAISFVDHALEVAAKPSLVDRARNYVRSLRFRRQVGAVVLSAAVLAPSAGVDIKSAAPMQQITMEDLPRVDEYSRIRADAFSRIDAAFIIDHCTPSLTPEEVKATYDAIYPSQDIRMLTDKELISETYSSYQQLADAQSEVTFVDRPQILQNLEEDKSSNDPHIPTSLYVDTLSSYVSRFGQRAVYSWTAPAGDSKKEQNYYSTNIIETDITSKEQASAIRQHTVNIIRALSRMPISIPKRGADSVVFGNIIDPQIGGQTLLQNEIYIDVPSSAGLKPGDDVQTLDDVYEHELGHNIMNKPCNGTTDFAFSSLNQGYQYSRDRNKNVASLKAQGIVDLQTKQLADASGQVVAARPYGWTNEFEDQATTFGEHVLNPLSSPSLMKSLAQSTVLNAKIAAEIARLGDGPEKRLYESQLHASTYVAELLNRFSTINSTLNRLKLEKEYGSTYYNHVLTQLELLQDAASVYARMVNVPDKTSVVIAPQYSAEYWIKRTKVDNEMQSDKQLALQAPEN